MGCLLGCLALLTPRAVLVLVFLFSGFLGRAYDSTIWPLLGFFFMPLTTLAYAAAINWNEGVTGGYFVMVLLAALIDLGVVGGTGGNRRWWVAVDRQRRGKPPEDKVYDATLD